ncbi:hypothetical protein ACVBAX_08790 [Robertmurraya sp. GLU-23]
MKNKKDSLKPKFYFKESALVDINKIKYPITQEGMQSFKQNFHPNYSEFYEDELIGHFSKINHNLTILGEIRNLSEQFPYLYKVIKRNMMYLTDFIHYSIDKLISPLSRIHRSKKQKSYSYYFYARSRDLPIVFNYGQYNTWNRNINIFCTVGLIKKVPIEKIENQMVIERAIVEKNKLAKRLGIPAVALKEVTFYTIPFYDDELLSQAESIAKVLLENNFRSNGFSKTYLIKVFGQEFANNVFQDERFITEYSNYVTNEIESFIIKRIDEKGYTTKDDIINNLQINLSKINVTEYGFNKGSKKNIIEREFNRSITQILIKNGLEYRKANKTIKEMYCLDGYKNIILSSETEALSSKV